MFLLSTLPRLAFLVVFPESVLSWLRIAALGEGVGGWKEKANLPSPVTTVSSTLVGLPFTADMADISHCRHIIVFQTCRFQSET